MAALLPWTEVVCHFWGRYVYIHVGAVSPEIYCSELHCHVAWTEIGTHLLLGCFKGIWDKWKAPAKDVHVVLPVVNFLWCYSCSNTLPGPWLMEKQKGLSLAFWLVFLVFIHGYLYDSPVFILQGCLCNYDTLLRQFKIIYRLLSISSLLMASLSFLFLILFFFFFFFPED